MINVIEEAYKRDSNVHVSQAGTRHICKLFNEIGAKVTNLKILQYFTTVILAKNNKFIIILT